MAYGDCGNYRMAVHYACSDTVKVSRAYKHDDCAKQCHASSYVPLFSLYFKSGSMVI